MTKIESFAESFQAGSAPRIITKIESILSRRVGNVNITNIPIEYDNKYGKFQGFYGLVTGYAQLFRLNFLLSGSDSIYSIDLYNGVSDSHPAITVDLNGFNIVQCLEAITEELEKGYVDTELNEGYRYSNKVVARFLEYTSDDRKNMLFNTWIDQENDSIDLLQNKRLAEVYTVFLKKDKRYNSEVNFASFQSMAKTYLFGRGLTNPSFRKRKKGSAEREVVDKAKEDQLRDIVDGMEVTKKFDFLASAVEAVVDNRIQSLLCYGSPGSGKSKTVMDTLDSLHVKPQVFSGGFKNTDELFKILTKYNDNEILCFDDCDSVFKSIDNRNLLKSILQNSEKRIVTWRDKKLEFTSGVIFISNLAKFDSAIASRSMTIEITLTNEQMLDHIENNLKEFMPEVDMKTKKMALDFLKEISSGVKTVDFRELQKTIISIQIQPKGWKDFALLMLSSQ